MGLDMYLYLRKNNANVNYDRNNEKLYPEELEEFECNIVKRDFASVYSSFDYLIGYWRKANAVHNWFVEVCGKGIDECQKIFASKEDLKVLLNLVNQVLENNYLASLLLPTQNGYFFGSLEYGDLYFEDLEYTKTLLEKVVKFLESNDDYVVYYQASW